MELEFDSGVDPTCFMCYFLAKLLSRYRILRIANMQGECCNDATLQDLVRLMQWTSRVVGKTLHDERDFSSNISVLSKFKNKQNNL